MAESELLRTKLMPDVPPQPSQAAQQMGETGQINIDQYVIDYADYTKASPEIKKLKGVLSSKSTIALTNRDLRYGNVDVAAEKKAGRLSQDEIYLPEHIIDSNVRREQAKYIAYIAQSSDVLLFEDVEDPAQNTQLMSKDFATKARFNGWQAPFFRTIDGMQLHGYSIMEVTFDETKPGHFSYEDVNYSDLAFYGDTQNIQACELIIRRHYYTKSQLALLVKENGFSATEVVKLLQKPDSSDTATASLIAVEKCLFRKGGVVHVAWSCEETCSGWLREPRPLFLGEVGPDKSQIFESQYPYVVYPYVVSEDTKIAELKGRAFLDQHDQEALTSLMSSFVTAHRRGAGFYFSKKTDDPNNTNKQLELRFVRDALIDANIQQFQLQVPDSTLLSSIQALRTKNMQENSQVNYAAQNRQDSRKTATEISAAQGDAQLLSLIQVALFSTSMKSVFDICWRIYSSRVVAGLIKTVVPAGMFMRQYTTKPAGDSQVVDRQRKIMQMMQAWTVVQGTAIAPLFLSKLLTLMFPEDAPAYLQLMAMDDAKTQILQKLITILAPLFADPVHDEFIAQAKPAVDALIAQAQQIFATPQTGAPQSGNAPPTNITPLPPQPEGAKLLEQNNPVL